MASPTSSLTAAICSYNRASRLPGLVARLRSQVAPCEFEILVVDNNSQDDTRDVLAGLARQPGAGLRYVTEPAQGISHARNRAIAESLDSDYMLFIDDDEQPDEGFIEHGYKALHEHGAQVVGGRVEVQLDIERPRWLTADLLGFLAQVDHGDSAFWITDTATSLWTANIGYDMSIFRDDPGLRFDIKYNREGNELGGGEDAVMFREFIRRHFRVRYEPRMRVFHHVESWRLRRSYFLRLHFEAGRKRGLYEGREYGRMLMGIPPFMLVSSTRMVFRSLGQYLSRKPEALRQAMNAAHEYGQMLGRFQRWKAVRAGSGQ